VNHKGLPVWMTGSPLSVYLSLAQARPAAAQKIIKIINIRTEKNALADPGTDFQ
jgi:hypothetical protein